MLSQPQWLDTAKGHSCFTWQLYVRELSSTHKLTDLGAFHLGRPPSFTCSLHSFPGKGRMFGTCGEFCGHIWKWYTYATGPDPVVSPKPKFVHSWEIQSFCISVFLYFWRRSRIAWFSTCSPRSRESASTGILLEKKICRLHHRPTETGARKSVFQRAPQETLVHIKDGESLGLG